MLADLILAAIAAGLGLAAYISDTHALRGDGRARQGREPSPETGTSPFPVRGMGARERDTLTH